MSRPPDKKRLPDDNPHSILVSPISQKTDLIYIGIVNSKLFFISFMYIYFRTFASRISYSKPSRYNMLKQCWFNIGQRRGRWTNVEPTFIQRIVCAELKHMKSGPSRKNGPAHQVLSGIIRQAPSGE